jgi:hypothetical protein
MLLIRAARFLRSDAPQTPDHERLAISVAAVKATVILMVAMATPIHPRAATS